MRTISILVVLALACVCSADFINFKGNVSLTGDKDSWNFRQTSMSAWDYDPLDGDGAKFSSISIGRTEHSIEGDTVWGEAAVQTTYPPIAWLAYASWGLYNDSNDWNVGGASGYVASAYVALEETAPNGTVVRTQSLKEGFLSSGLQWDTTNKGVNNELKYITLTGGIQNQPWSVALTFIVSDVVGVIDKADAVVTPKSLESIVEIKDWNYKDSANTLTLVVAAATGEVSVKGSALVSGGDADDDQVYFALAKKAVVGGKKEDVHISHYADADFDATFANPNFKFQIQGVYGSKSSCKLVRVTFPAGASDILYDPTIGAGAVAESHGGESSSAYVITANFVVFAAAVSFLGALVF